MSEQTEEKEDPYKYQKLGQEVFIIGLPESVTEDSLKELFSSYGEIHRIKFLPARDHLNGKAWIALDSPELAQKAKEEIGGEDGDFDMEGQDCKIRVSDYELTLKKFERINERQRTIYVGNLNFRVEDWQLEDYFIQFG